MTRSERKRYFEQLVALRDAYRTESAESTGLTIDQAMRYAERLFNEAAATDLADAAAIETTLRQDRASD